MAPNCNSPNDRCAIWRISHPYGYILLLLALYLLLHLKTTDMDLYMITTTIYDSQRSVVDCMLVLQERLYERSTRNYRSLLVLLSFA